MAAARALLVALGLVLLGGGGAAEVGTPPPGTPPPFRCTQLGPGGVLLDPVLLRLRGEGGGTGTPPHGGDAAVTFDVTDPWEVVAEVWAPPWSAPPPHCELSATVPVLTPPAWATPHPRSPPALGGAWWLVTLATPRGAATVLLRGEGEGAAPRPRNVTEVTVALAVFTLTPHLVVAPGPPLELHCAFAAPPGPFALEWRHRHRGAGRLLLTYDSATAAVPEATPGHQLLLGGAGSPPHGGGRREVMLRLERPALDHDGTFVCSVFLGLGQAQQLLRLRLQAPPKVTLSPRPLVVAPGTVAELRCEATGYFPLDVGLRWQRRAGGSGPWLSLGDEVAQSWSSGHRRGPDGTYSRGGGLRLLPGQGHRHGDVIACVVTHEALGGPRRVKVRLEVAGTAWPSLEDAVGLALVAFVICGLWRWLRPPAPGPDPDTKKTQ